MMSFILKNPTKEEVINAIESNRFELYKNSWNMYDILKKKITPDFKCYFTGHKSPLLNGLIYTKINDILQKTINEIFTFFEEQNTPFIWHTGSNILSKKLKEKLVKRNFQIETLPGMALNLNIIPDKNKFIPNLEIIKIKNAEQIKWTTEVFCTVFDVKQNIVIDLLEASLNTQEIDFYLGLLDGKPVSTSGVVYASGVAGIYFISTLIEARKRGIGTASTYKPLFDAKKRGFQWAILHSSEMGVEMYKKMGFEHYSDITQCIWMPKND